jgi:hypothetical protein
LTQGTPAPHAPFVSHVSTPSIAHWVVPGAQLPVQVPPEHADAVHVTPSTQEPLPSHV